MAGLAAAAPYIGMGLTAIGTLSSAKAKKQEGKIAEKQSQEAAKNERISAEFEAMQADYLAGQAVAISQREAFGHRQAAALLASKALANAAASGAGASDQTVVDLIGEIYAEGAYRSALAIYEGQETSRSYVVSGLARRLGGSSAAAARIAEGQSIARASNLSAFSTLISGGSSLATQAYNIWGGAKA